MIDVSFLTCFKVDDASRIRSDAVHVHLARKNVLVGSPVDRTSQSHLRSILIIFQGFGRDLTKGDRDLDYNGQVDETSKMRQS